MRRSVEEITAACKTVRTDVLHSQGKQQNHTDETILALYKRGMDAKAIVKSVFGIDDPREFQGKALQYEDMTFVRNPIQFYCDNVRRVYRTIILHLFVEGKKPAEILASLGGENEYINALFVRKTIEGKA